MAATGVVGAAVGAVAGNYYGTQTTLTQEQSLRAELENLKKKIPVQPESEVRVYTWSEYIAEHLIEVFKMNTGINVIYDTYESTDEMRAKVTPGQSGYDVVMVTDYMIPEFVELGLLAEVDTALLPNTIHLDDKFKNPDYDPGNKHSMPYLWGTTGFGWNSAKVADMKSWADIFEPAKVQRYSKTVTMLDDMRETIGAAMKFLGHSLNDLDEGHLNDAKQVLLAQKPYLAKYTGALEYSPGLSGGRFMISHAYSGDAFVAQADNPDIRYTIPEEGCTLWVDNMTVLKDAPHPIAAHAWINYILDPTVMAIISNVRYYANPNKDSVPFLNTAVAEDPALYPPEDVYKKLEIMKPVTPEEMEKYQRVWLDVVG
jgi:spermidine/putrescine transport system substrate-binding protein